MMRTHTQNGVIRVKSTFPVDQVGAVSRMEEVEIMDWIDRSLEVELVKIGERGHQQRGLERLEKNRLDRTEPDAKRRDTGKGRSQDRIRRGRGDVSDGMSVASG